MKIISNFKDYYDSIQSYGADEEVVYLRKEDTIDSSKLEDFDTFCSEFINYGQTYTFEKLGANSYYDERVIATQLLLGFCGQLHFGYRFDTIEKGSPIKSIVYYSVDEANAYVRSISKTHNTSGFKLASQKSLAQPRVAWFHALKAPIFVFPDYITKAENINLNWNEDIAVQPQELVLNPNLKALDFHKIKDAFSCYQEIQHFISGVLGDGENYKNESLDSDRIEQQGFDKKYGFRTRPKK